MSVALNCKWETEKLIRVGEDWAMEDQFKPYWYFSDKINDLLPRVKHRFGNPDIFFNRLIHKFIKQDPLAKLLNQEVRFKLIKLGTTIHLELFGDRKDIFIAPANRYYQKITWELCGDYDCSSSNLQNLRVGVPNIVKGNFNCSRNRLKDLTGGPSIVTGGYDCSFNMIDSLNGAPAVTVKYFNCSYNRLESLRLAPDVKTGFHCNNNRLRSLKYSPRTINGLFTCGHNPLSTLAHAPEIVTSDFLCDNATLVSLHGAPTHIGGSFFCPENYLDDLIHGPETVNGSYICFNNSLRSAEGAPTYVGDEFDASDNPDLPPETLHQLTNQLDLSRQNHMP